MTDASLQSPLLLVLHALRLRSVAPSWGVAHRFELDLVMVDDLLAGAHAAGWVQRREGILAGWTLTAAGRREGERLLADQLESTGTRSTIDRAYSGFLGLNGELLAICTEWQVVSVDGAEIVNDHRDAERDSRVLGRLDRLHQAARPVLELLESTLGRFGGYGQRLGAAHARITSGATEWLTRPTIDSYHTVWFELHEDLLATLGRRRTDERHG